MQTRLIPSPAVLSPQPAPHRALADARLRLCRPTDERGHHELPLTTRTGSRSLQLAAALGAKLGRGAKFTVAQLGRALNRDVALRRFRDPNIAEPVDIPPLACDADEMWRAQQAHLRFILPKSWAAVKANCAWDGFRSNLNPIGWLRAHSSRCTICTNPFPWSACADPPVGADGVPLPSVPAGRRQPAACRRRRPLAYWQRARTDGTVASCEAGRMLFLLPIVGVNVALTFEPRFADMRDNMSCRNAPASELNKEVAGEVGRHAIELAPSCPANPRTFVRKQEFAVDAAADADADDDAIPVGVYKMKTRMCVDVGRDRCLNAASPSVPMRYAGAEHVLRLMSRGCFFQSRDLVKGFQQVGLHKRLRRLMAFRHGPRQRRWRYRCVPFGWSLAPFVFSLLTAELVAIVQAAGFRATAYLDDFLVLGDTKEECDAAAAFLDRMLDVVGFRTHRSKGQHVSQRTVEYLGFVFDSRSMTVAIPLRKRDALRAELGSALSSRRIPLRVFKGIVGKLQWASACVRGSRARLRILHAEKARAVALNFTFVDRARAGISSTLEWWVAALGRLERKGNCVLAQTRIWAADRPLPVMVVKGDASGDSNCGFGAVFGDEAVFARWDAVAGDLSESTTCLELAPILAAVRHWGERWASRLVVFGTDNRGTFYGINCGRVKGGASGDVANALVVEIFEVCHRYNIDLVASWVPRSFNQDADDLSKLTRAQLHSRFPSLVEVADPLPAARAQVAGAGSRA